ncbi:MAG: isoprenyl transferase [Thermodesulfobacteriota bacterium]
MSLELDSENLPRHVAIIMDGNGRWAQARGLPRLAGHRAGAEAVRAAIKTCRRLGIPYLTLYAFSQENWGRPKAEVDGLMRLLRRYVRSEIEELHRHGVRINIIGALEHLPADTVRLLQEAMARTAANEDLTLSIALSYGGRPEIIRACRLLARDCLDGRIEPEAIDEAAFGGFLYTAGLPDPDLLIRTGGEHRVSNFLLWQIAYAEIYISDVFWPDFGEDHLQEAVRNYQRRQRRFGLTGEQIVQGRAGETKSR